MYIINTEVNSSGTAPLDSNVNFALYESLAKTVSTLGYVYGVVVLVLTVVVFDIDLVCLDS